MKNFKYLVLLLFMFIIVFVIGGPISKSRKKIEVVSFNTNSNCILNENIELTIVFKNFSNTDINSIIINGVVISEFSTDTTNGRVKLSYLVEEKDIKNDSIFLNLQGFIANEKENKTYNLLIKELQNE